MQYHNAVIQEQLKRPLTSFLGLPILAALIIIGAAMCFACAGTSVDATRFAGTWRLVAVDSRPLGPLPADQVPVFTVIGTRVSGFDGCNTFSGRIDQPGEISATRMGCREGAIQLPLDLGNLLAHLQTGTIKEKSLSVPANGQFPASVFERAN